MTQVEQVIVRLADPVFFARHYPMAERGVSWCAALSPSPYFCTREKYHKGPHVAHLGSESVVEVWE